MKVYTRGGDKGRTSLFSGARVGKDDARIEALGTIDELVAVLGIAKAVPQLEDPAPQKLSAVQTELYLIMADLASDAAGEGRLSGDAIQSLEAAIDAMDTELPPLTEFIIPGASQASAALHHARTVCRRAERRVLAAAGSHELPPAVLPYLNRLSDLLFVMARWVDRNGAADARTFKENL